MPTATKPKSAKPSPAEELRRFHQPGVREQGLKTLAQRQDAAAAKKDAPKPETASDEHLRLTVEKIVADAELSLHLKEQAEKAKLEAEAEKSEAFSRAYARWLRACAHLEAPDLDRSEDEQFMHGLYAEERAAQRELFSIPATNREIVWNKLEVFETDLVEELVVGPSVDSVLLFALGSIKADLMNMMEEK